MTDILTPVAPQSTSNAALIPCAVGWCLQLFLSGTSTAQTFQVLRKRKRYFAHHKTDRYLLLAALLANLFVTCLVIWSTVAWTSTQERSTMKIYAYKTPDAVWPVFSALVSCITQGYMAKRCYKLVQRYWLLIAMSTLITAAFAGSVWSTVTATLYSLGKGPSQAMFIPTQIWLWSSVVTDVLITAALGLHLSGLKQGFSADMDTFIDSIIRVGFETCAAPLFFTICSAISYAATWDNHLMWNLYAATSSFLPSVYLLSFVYCVEATHTRKENYEASRSGGASRKQPDAERGDKAPPPAICRNPQDTISWAPPLNWHSVPGDPEPVLLFTETVKKN